MNIPKKELSNDPVFHRILTLLKEQNKTQKSLIDYLNIHPNTRLVRLKELNGPLKPTKPPAYYY